MQIVVQLPKHIVEMEEVFNWLNKHDIKLNLTNIETISNEANCCVISPNDNLHLQQSELQRNADFIESMMKVMESFDKGGYPRHNQEGYINL